ncbi:MAG TPA: signal peptidase II [Oscillospiraceae bacterium]|nr:signal peptidase II [Oscillospiraceae bacterium]
MVYAIVIAALVALDQVVKYLVATRIPLGGAVPFLPHILELTNMHNTGAAFSFLSGATWVLALASAAVSFLLAMALIQGFFRHPLGNWTLSVLLAGAVGNLIDRVRLGYVVDMFRPLFVNFAVFNVADICVTLSAIFLMVYVVFLYDKLEKGPSDETSDGHGGA